MDHAYEKRSLLNLSAHHTLECRFEKGRFVRGTLESDVSVGTDEDQPAVACSVALRKGF